MSVSPGYSRLKHWPLWGGDHLQLLSCYKPVPHAKYTYYRIISAKVRKIRQACLSRELMLDLNDVELRQNKQ